MSDDYLFDVDVEEVEPGLPDVWIRLADLSNVFDVRPKEPHERSGVGLLSSLLGEGLVLELARHWLANRHQGDDVTDLQKRPVRDNSQFPRGIPSGEGARLDTYITGGTSLYAVEAKMWTGSSTFNPYLKLSPEDRSRQLWKDLQNAELEPMAEFNQINKIGLPLSPLPGYDLSNGYALKRVLAVWLPVSSHPRDSTPHVSHGTLKTWSAGKLVPVPYELFSASLYVASLLKENPDLRVPLRRKDVVWALHSLRRLVDY